MFDQQPGSHPPCGDFDSTVFLNSELPSLDCNNRLMQGNSPWGQDVTLILLRELFSVSFVSHYYCSMYLFHVSAHSNMTSHQHCNYLRLYPVMYCLYSINCWMIVLKVRQKCSLNPVLLISHTIYLYTNMTISQSLSSYITTIYYSWLSCQCAHDIQIIPSCLPTCTRSLLPLPVLLLCIWTRTVVYYRQNLLWIIVIK